MCYAVRCSVQEMMDDVLLEIYSSVMFTKRRRDNVRRRNCDCLTYAQLLQISRGSLLPRCVSLYELWWQDLYMATLAQ